MAKKKTKLEEANEKIKLLEQTIARLEARIKELEGRDYIRNVNMNSYM